MQKRWLIAIYQASLPSCHQYWLSQLPPPLADVLTIRTLASELVPIPAKALDKLDNDLALIPVTREAAVARCARYDHIPPRLPDKIARLAILVFSKSNGFRDDPSVNAAIAMLKVMAGRKHWTLFFSDSAAVFNARDLKRFDCHLEQC